LAYISMPQILKVMNLTNYGVQEMNAKEVIEVDGGNDVAEDIGYAIGWVLGMAVASVLVAAKIVVEKVL